MEQLLKVTTNNFQSIKFSQNAKLVPSSSVDIERRKAMAKHMAFRARNSQNIEFDVDSVNKINKAFSNGKTVRQPIDSSFSGSMSDSDFMKTMATTTTASYKMSAAPKIETASDSTSIAETASYYLPESNGYSYTEIDYEQQAQSSYCVERGSFEMKVATGDISYIPAFEMTIVTQYPSVEFEYVGDYHFLPPVEESNYSFVNLSI